MTPRSRGHGSGGGDEPPSGGRGRRSRGGRPGNVEQGEGHARETFQRGRPTDAGGGPSSSSRSRSSSSGVQFRGDGVSTGPLSERDLDRLGLDGILDDASAETGREVHIMIFRTIEEAAGRKPTIKVWF